jgi:hypothetical protein
MHAPPMYAIIPPAFVEARGHAMMVCATFVVTISHTYTQNQL